MKDSTFGIYFDSFCAFATPCQHNSSVASNFMIKNPILQIQIKIVSLYYKWV
jgi:hypothetical protein